jgi:hypothetical protein
MGSLIAGEKGGSSGQGSRTAVGAAHPAPAARARPRTSRNTSASSHWRRRKKQDAIAWRPGMVSHSLGLAPTT